ncbi:hypothetical protein C8A01DRAFT_33935 [Parachaetomium inaequale]|uniref:Uncharacterized protein n=1 Tax=Parachaetomium inaequale TaxID=2588326 RepID=A0AAN6PJB5_9PEZI|nr:hypothetical protein C8A01DRAFT_33935 [Parachaetomium inaequale]
MPSIASSIPPSSSSSILALSTPFVQPATCTNIFSTSILTATVRSTNIISGSTSRFAFSPAVCPSGWTAYNLGTDGPVSTADCCARYNYLPPTSYLTSCLLALVRSSGYSAARPSWATGIDGLQTGTPGCFKRVTAPRASGVLDTFPGPVDVQAHNAYHVSWQASDTAMLTPQPPAITCPYGIDMWVPGSPVTSKACDSTWVNDTGISPRVAEFVTIGVPIIVCVVVFGLVGCYCYAYRKGKREQQIRAAARARAAREQNERDYSAPASVDQS